MPIKSYLLFPHAGKATDLLVSLSQLKNCEIFPADQREVVVLISDTSSDQEEEELLLKLQSEESLHHINFISGFTTAL